MMKSSSSMLSTSCRMVATRMMKKNSLWLLQEFNMYIQFLNQFDKNPLHVLQIVGLVFVELVLEDEFLCCHILQLLQILCTACFKSSLLRCSHLAVSLAHLHPSFRFCFVRMLSPRKNGPLLRSRRTQYMCSHPIQC